MSSGSWVPAWAVGFVNVQQSVCIEIMHLGDSGTRYLMSKKTSGVFEMSALSRVLIAEKCLDRKFTQIETGFLRSRASNGLLRFGSRFLLTAVPRRRCRFPFRHGPGPVRGTNCMFHTAPRLYKSDTARNALFKKGVSSMAAGYSCTRRLTGGRF